VTQRVYRKQHVVPSVVAVIVDDVDRVVLTRRSIAPFRGLWVMPGGKIDLGEPIAAAVHREVREEIGIDVVVGGLVDVFEHLTPGPDNDHFVILYYRCRASTRELAPNPAEVAEARWVGRDELPRYPVADGTRHVLGILFPELRSTGAWRAQRGRRGGKWSGSSRPR
jgi:8-oxo-dGTP diphosphatase